MARHREGALPFAPATGHGLPELLGLLRWGPGERVEEWMDLPQAHLRQERGDHTRNNPHFQREALPEASGKTSAEEGGRDFCEDDLGLGLSQFLPLSWCDYE